MPTVHKIRTQFNTSYEKQRIKSPVYRHVYLVYDSLISGTTIPCSVVANIKLEFVVSIHMSEFLFIRFEPVSWSGAMGVVPYVVNGGSHCPK